MLKEHYETFNILLHYIHMLDFKSQGQGSMQPNLNDQMINVFSIENRSGANKWAEERIPSSLTTVTTSRSFT